MSGQVTQVAKPEWFYAFLWGIRRQGEQLKQDIGDSLLDFPYQVEENGL